jgi:hypothetical protein
MNHHSFTQPENVYINGFKYTRIFSNESNLKKFPYQEVYHSKETYLYFCARFNVSNSKQTPNDRNNIKTIILLKPNKIILKYESDEVRFLKLTNSFIVGTKLNFEKELNAYETFVTNEKLALEMFSGLHLHKVPSLESEYTSYYYDILSSKLIKYFKTDVKGKFRVSSLKFAEYRFILTGDSTSGNYIPKKSKTIKQLTDELQTLKE